MRCVAAIICAVLLAGATFSAASAATTKLPDDKTWLMRMMSC